MNKIYKKYIYFQFRSRNKIYLDLNKGKFRIIREKYLYLATKLIINI